MQTPTRPFAHCVFSLAFGLFVVSGGCSSPDAARPFAEGTGDAADSSPHTPDAAADSSPQASSDAGTALDSSTSVGFEIGDGGKPTCTPACAVGKACSYSHQCLTASSCPASDVGVRCAPGVVGVWMANGKDKINKLENVVLCVHREVTAKIYDAQGKLFLTVPDVFCKQTNLNDSLAPGLYYGEFYDSLGNVIPTPADVHEDLLIE